MGTGHREGQSPDSVHLSAFRERCTPEGHPAMTKHGRGRGSGHFHPDPDQGRQDNCLGMKLGWEFKH